MPQAKTQKSLRRILVVPDVHVPYHDRRAFSLMLKVAKALPPDVIISIGDFADFFSISRHSKDPDRRFRFKEELEIVNEELSKLDDLGAKEKYYIAGNHEARMDKYINEVAPEFNRMHTLESVLHLERRGWKLIPYHDKRLTVRDIAATHDVGVAGKNAVARSMQIFNQTIYTGHTHRLSYIVECDINGAPFVGASFGWLGDNTQIGYAQRDKVVSEWPHAFGIAYQRMDKKISYTFPIVIAQDYTCVVDGRLFEA